MALSTFLRASSQAGGCCIRQLTQGSLKLNPTIFQASPSLQNLRPILVQAGLQIHKPGPPIFEPVRSLRTSTVNRNIARQDTADHSKLWVIEKAVSAGLLVLIPISLLVPAKPLDVAVSILAVSHIYWGLEAIVVDYIRAVIFGPLIPKVAKFLLYAIMVITIGGLYHLIFHDIGIANTIRRFWGIAKKNE